MSQTPLLRYFDIQGKAEAIRLLFEDNGIQYEEERIGADWREKKPKYIEQGICQFGQLPVVSIGDKHMVQTNAILRHFARVHDLYGRNNEECYTADCIADGVDDWRSRYVKLVYGPEYETNVVEFVKTFLPHAMGMFEKQLNGAQSAPFFVRSDKPTFADYLVFDAALLSLRLDATCLDNFPNCKKFYETMRARKGIADYLSSSRVPAKVNNSGKGQ
jgi:glutathione S-transferase